MLCSWGGYVQVDVGVESWMFFCVTTRTFSLSGGKLREPAGESCCSDILFISQRYVSSMN